MSGTGAEEFRAARTRSCRQLSSHFPTTDKVVQEFRGETVEASLTIPGHLSPRKSTGLRGDDHNELIQVKQNESREIALTFRMQHTSKVSPSRQSQVHGSKFADEVTSTASRGSVLLRQYSAHFQLHDVDKDADRKQESPCAKCSGDTRPSSSVKHQICGDVMSTDTQEIRNELYDEASRQETLSKVAILPLQRKSARLQADANGAITSKKDAAVATLLESDLPVSKAANFHESKNEIQFFNRPSSSTVNPTLSSLYSSFVPLQVNWTYGQRVFGRYKKTPYFYSGNIATSLGKDLFMVVFDDGTLNYRVRSENIMVRTLSKKQHKCMNQDEPSVAPLRSNSVIDSETENDDNAAKALTDKILRNNPRYEPTSDDFPDSSVSPEMHLLSSQHVMVDFSISPPREMIINFDENGTTCELEDSRCGSTSACNELWRLLLEDDTLSMKRLDCGVGYEDDSTQVSDSAKSSEEDISMTPWQQMTQTFGMGKSARAGRRSSKSSVDRLSITQKSMKQKSTAPRSLKQLIIKYFLRGNKKVQPSKLTSEVVLAERIRRMEAKLDCMRLTQDGTSSATAATSHRASVESRRVVYERNLDGVRAYGIVMEQDEEEKYAVVSEDDECSSVHVVSKDKVEFLPSKRDLEQQLTDLKQAQRALFAGQKVEVLLYPGSPFSGRGLITLEREDQACFHVLLANRIRLVNVPADMIIPLDDKKKTAATITDDQFLVCSNKVKIYIGEQIYVKCLTENGDYDATSEEERLGFLNGIYSDRTAAVDFPDGSTGYNVPSHLIFKRKLESLPADQEMRSRNSDVVVQTLAVANGEAKASLLALEEGLLLEAKHPRKAAVETCTVIKVHPSSACDLRFLDGTIAYEVFPSQMMSDNVEHQHKPMDATMVKRESFKLAAYEIGDYVLAWSSRFGRYCSAKIIVKISQDLDCTSGPLVSTSVNSMNDDVATTIASGITISNAAVSTLLYTLVFDYGEKKELMPAGKIAPLNDTYALAHAQQLTNVGLNTMGHELAPAKFWVGESVMARVHGLARYFRGVVEKVDEKERVCEVFFDSSVRDIAVPFSAMFSVDSRTHCPTRSMSTNKQISSRANTFSELVSQALAHQGVQDETTPASKTVLRSRRHSANSVGNMLKSMDNFFRGSRVKATLEPQSSLHDEGAHVQAPEQ